MAIAKIQSGDKVKVISGSYKGTEGVVTKVVTKKQGKKPSIIRAAVSTVPAIIKYKKANRAYNLPGEKLTTDRMINISNLSVVDEKGKPSRVKIQIDNETGKKTRSFTSTNKVIKKTKPEEKVSKKTTKKLDTDKGTDK